MRNLIIGILIGMAIGAPLAYAAAKDIRVSDSDGTVLDVNSDGTVTIKFGSPS